MRRLRYFCAGELYLIRVCMQFVFALICLLEDRIELDNPGDGMTVTSVSLKSDLEAQRDLTQIYII